MDEPVPHGMRARQPQVPGNAGAMFGGLHGKVQARAVLGAHANQSADGVVPQACLSAMRPSAIGMDEWSLKDVRAFPDRVLHSLAQLLMRIEEMGHWPWWWSRDRQPSSPHWNVPPNGPIHGV